MGEGLSEGGGGGGLAGPRQRGGCARGELKVRLAPAQAGTGERSGVRPVHPA